MACFAPAAAPSPRWPSGTLRPRPAGRSVQGEPGDPGTSCHRDRRGGDPPPPRPPPQSPHAFAMHRAGLFDEWFSALSGGSLRGLAPGQGQVVDAVIEGEHPAVELPVQPIKPGARKAPQRLGRCVGAHRPAPAAHAARRAVVTGKRAARTAGNSPPTNPIASAHLSPFHSSPGVTLNSKVSWPTPPARVEAV